MRNFGNDSSAMSFVGCGHYEAHDCIRMLCLQRAAEFGFQMLFEQFNFGIQLETIFDSALITGQMNDADPVESLHLGMASDVDFAVDVPDSYVWLDRDV